MAGFGPPPKDPALRRRQNKPPEKRELAGGRRAPALGLPGVLKATRDWWSTVWASPMASAWLDADVPALRRLAAMVELVNRGEVSMAMLAEIRQLEDRFGLSPLARSRLQWKEPDEAPKATPEPAAKTQEDRFLRAVGS